MTGLFIGGVALVGVLLWALSLRSREDDYGAVSEEWVKTQIRERGVRRQA